LKIAYSLLERTVEGELIPMARELGLVVTPYKVLSSGILSGKYTRANAARAQPLRGAVVTGALTEGTFRLIDLLTDVAHQLDSTPARVALAWVHSSPALPRRSSECGRSRNSKKTSARWRCNSTPSMWPRWRRRRGRSSTFRPPSWLSLDRTRTAGRPSTARPFRFPRLRRRTTPNVFNH
jgi:Aldo/keto reductase family